MSALTREVRVKSNSSPKQSRGFFATTGSGWILVVSVFTGCPSSTPLEAGEPWAKPCEITDPCMVSRSDPPTGACVDAPKPDGTRCEQGCSTGACLAGACQTQRSDCDDFNACTADSCGQVSCDHAPVACPMPTETCRVPTCDPMTGCAVEPAPDGTLCGPDDCLATQVDVCVLGECVRRPRSPEGRCVNTWRPVTIGNRVDPAMAFDSARQRVVLFGGHEGVGFIGDRVLADTWEWDGATWRNRLPPSSPPARRGHSMAFDRARQRVVLHGGIGADYRALSDTWEWDGTTWVERKLANSAVWPQLGMVFDSRRQRLLLLGGTISEWTGSSWTPLPGAWGPAWFDDSSAVVYDEARHRTVLWNGRLGETWEWDGPGTAWDKREPMNSPPGTENTALAYDEARRRVVLFGGSRDGAALVDTWEWDGNTWSQRTPVNRPSPRRQFAMTYDGARQRVALFGGEGVGNDSTSDTWEWDGTEWNEAGPPRSPPPGSLITTDTGRQRIVFLTNNTLEHPLYETWEWDGTTWTRPPRVQTSPRGPEAIAYDTSRARVVTYGGFDREWGWVALTWEWDTTTWQQQAGASPSSRITTMAYDEARSRVVMFGGARWNSSAPDAGQLSDTWEWDGSAWTERQPQSSPSVRSGHAMAYDELRRRLVLFGGFDAFGLTAASPAPAAFNDTWEWDGVDWAQRGPMSSPPARVWAEMAWDPSRQRIVLFGGFDPLIYELLNDTWEFDGVTWVRRLPLMSPPTGSGYGSMAFDPTRLRMVFVNRKNTWEFFP